MTSVTTRRAFGSILLQSYLPCAYHPSPLPSSPSAQDVASWESFEEITNGAWRPAKYVDERHTGSGTTCGFLPSWFLWRIGCIDSNVVNRTCVSATQEKIGVYTAGHNICAINGLCGSEAKPIRKHSYKVRIYGDAKNSEAFQRGELRPKLGDIVFVKTGTNFTNSMDEHVFVFINNYQDTAGNERWQTAEAGGPTSEYAGKQMHVDFWREQAVIIDKRAVGKKAGAVQLISNKETRYIIGWVDLDRIQMWGDFILDPGRNSSVPGYPPQAKLPTGGTAPWSALAVTGGMLDTILPGLGGSTPQPGQLSSDAIPTIPIPDPIHLPKIF